MSQSIETMHGSKVKQKLHICSKKNKYISILLKSFVMAMARAFIVTFVHTKKKNKTFLYFCFGMFAYRVHLSTKHLYAFILMLAICSTLDL